LAEGLADWRRQRCRRGSREIAFAIECSVRSAWEVIYILLTRGAAPPPVYHGQYDPKALFNLLKVFVCGDPRQWLGFMHPGTP
jgi:hypothetical protein